MHQEKIKKQPLHSLNLAVFQELMVYWQKATKQCGSSPYESGGYVPSLARTEAWYHRISETDSIIVTLYKTRERNLTAQTIIALHHFPSQVISLLGFC